MNRGWENFELHTRNTDVKGEDSDANENHVIGTWRKNDPCYEVAKNLTELCSSLLWKVALVSDEIRYLAKICMQSIASMASFLLITYSKM